MNKKGEYKKFLEGLCDDSYDYTKNLDVLAIHKQECVTNNNADEANEIWGYEQIIKINQGFVEVFNLIHNKKYYDAWCKAEQVEIMINSLKRNFTNQIDNIDYIERQIKNTQALYPYKLFSSYEMVYEQVECSICNKLVSIRNQCEHTKGYVYFGEQCCHKIKKIKSIVGISMVTNPVHKFAVPFISDEEGETHDHYDYNAVELLASIWSSPYMYWTLEVQIKWLPHLDFPNLKDSDGCPCGSTKEYKDCCKINSKGIKHLHYMICHSNE